MTVAGRRDAREYVPLSMPRTPGGGMKGQKAVRLLSPDFPAGTNSIMGISTTVMETTGRRLGPPQRTPIQAKPAATGGGPQRVLRRVPANTLPGGAPEEQQRAFAAEPLTPGPAKARAQGVAEANGGDTLCGLFSAKCAVRVPMERRVDEPKESGLASGVLGPRTASRAPRAVTAAAACRGREVAQLLDAISATQQAAAAAAAEPAGSGPASPLGTVEVLAAVKASKAARDTLGSSMVLTPVRRSVRKVAAAGRRAPATAAPAVGARGNAVAELLAATGYAYEPNSALQPCAQQQPQWQAKGVDESEAGGGCQPLALDFSAGMA